MSIKVDHNHLKEALRIIGASGEKHNGVFVILIETDKSSMTLTASSQMTCVKTKIPAVVSAKADKITAAFAADKLVTIVGHLTEPVELDVAKDGSIFVVSGKARFRLPTHDLSVLPDHGIPAKLTKTIKVQADIFRQMMALAHSATSNADKDGYSLRSVHVVVKDKTLKVEGCDGFEVMIAKTQIESEGDLDVVIPKDVFTSTILALKASETVELTTISGGNKFVIRVGDTIIVNRVLATKYPNIASMMPKDHDLKFQADSKDMITALKRVTCFTDYGEVYFNITEDQINLSAASTSGEIEEFVFPLEPASPYEMKLNGTRIFQCLSELKTQNFIMTYGGAKRSVTIKPMDAELDLTYMTTLLVD